MQSLRKRAWISGGLTGLVAVAVGTALLYSFLDQKALARFDTNLVERHTRIVVALSTTSGDPEQLGNLIFDPAYAAAGSGQYWQVTGSDGQVYTSASLLDATLPDPETPARELLIFNAEGPDQEAFRVAHQRITLQDGSDYGVSVADSLASLEEDRADTRQSLLLAFALVALLGLAGTLLQTTVILAPIVKLRKDVAQRWERDEVLTAADYPEEVAPLVSDINTLLDRNREIVSRSRRQAADLAHALKTPVAILRNELTQAVDQDAKLEKAVDALDRLDAQLTRSMARIRMSNTGEMAQTWTDLSGTIDRFARVFGKLAERDGKILTISCSPGLKIRVDTQDFEEILGNLLDNALKWSRQEIRLQAQTLGDNVEILVEDDGVGIRENDRIAVLTSGRRLDTSKPGTGLGLAIATDLLRAYGGTLELGASAGLGGLTVRVLLPIRRTDTAATEPR